MNEWDATLENRIRDAAREYNSPPEQPPREAMWAAIRAARAAGHEGRPTRRRPRWTVGAVGLAAAVVIGIALGRTTALLGPAAHSPAGAVTDASSEATLHQDRLAARRAGPYRLAATEHLGRAEALLVQFRSTPGHEPDDLDTAAWARELLLSTRLLLDSPAADDPEMRALLEDLELVLAQIAHLPGGDETERALVEQGIEDRHVLLRLRTAVPAGSPLRSGA